MNLRKLKTKDIPFMLEWMHDAVVTEYLRSNFKAMTIDDCRAFVFAAQDLKRDVHMAIVDACDVYMGTVSLKHIADGCAEFAIVLRESAMGMGFSKYAMCEMLRIGFEEKGLKQIYWCVDKKNERACRFYEKNGYKKIDLRDSGLLTKVLTDNYSLEQVEKYLWYLAQK